MKPEEQRIAIAEACGWKRNEDGVWLFPWKSTHISALDNELPDYETDLNAMHEAEKVLSEGDLAEYCEVIQDICRTCNEAIHATSAQRAEAFLKTLGLWKE